MKKIASIILLGFVLVIGFKGYQYYNDTYKATLAYAKVPATVPNKEEAVDDSGKKIIESDGSVLSTYNYSFDFVKQDGKKQIQTFSLTGKDPEPYAPETYVKAEISNKRVVKGPYVVSEKEIPSNILDKIK